MRAEEALARGADHDRAAQRQQLVQTAQQLEVVRDGLAEADARVEQHAPLAHALAHGERQALLEERLDLVDHVVIARVLLHRARLAAHVHQAALRAAVAPPAPPSRGRARNALTSLTRLAPASSAARATDALDVSIEICGRAWRAGPILRGDPLDHGQHPTKLLLRATRARRPGASTRRRRRRCPRPRSASDTRVRDRGVGVQEAPAVGERVRRDVDDPHQAEAAGGARRRVQRRSSSTAI